MSEGDRGQWNQLMAASGAQARPMVDPTTLPDYRPDMMYDNYGTIAYAYGGGSPGGVSSAGMGSVGAPNMGGGAGFVGSSYGYTPAGPPVASIGGFGQRGQGINADASMYRGGDFAGAGMGDFAFGPGTPTENITGSPVADLSQNPYSPMDPNATAYDGYGSTWGIDGETGIEWGSRLTQPGDYVPISYGIDGTVSGGYYSGGGIGSDAGATGGRQELANTIYNGGGIGSDAARAPNDYGSSSYPYPGGARPQPMQPQPPFQGPTGWPYGPAGGGWGFGRTGSVSDPGQNVDLGFGQYQPGAGGGNFDPQNPGGSGLGYGYGNFPGSLGNDLMPNGELPPNFGQPNYDSIGQFTHPGGG